MSLPRIWVLTTALALLAVSSGSAEEPKSFADCERLLAADPGTQAQKTAYCFFEAGERLHRRREAAERLERAIRFSPQAPWGHFYLGQLRFDETEAAERLFTQAAAEMAGLGDARGELQARVNRSRLLRALGRREEAEQEIRRIAALDRSSGARLSPPYHALAAMTEASFLVAAERDLDRALSLLAGARRQVERAEQEEPGSADSLRRQLLQDLAAAQYSSGRLQESRATAKSLVALAREQKDRAGEAYGLYYELRALREEMTDAPRMGCRQEALDLARRTLTAAEEAGQTEIEAKTRTILALLTTGDEARGHVERALALARTDADRSFALSVAARLEAGRDPRRAEHSVEEALAAAQRAREPRLVLYALRERMRASWLGGDGERSWQDSLADLDAIEQLRLGQAGRRSQAGYFSVFTSHYYLIAGNLLRRYAERGERADLERAFLVSERLRSRTLADALATGRRSAPSFAALDEVRGALAPDEALLSFQIAPLRDMRQDFLGGSWLLVVTREGERLYPLRHRLAERFDLRRAVGRFNGFFARRDGSEAPLAAELHRALLADALRDLDGRIGRLIVVPDDFLYLLPFAALRPSPEAPPLAARYQLEEVPSASLWLGWRRARVEPAAAPIVVFADPTQPASVQDPGAVERDAARFAADHRLGSLPFARREGSAAVRRLGEGSELLVGAGASEAQLKQLDLRRFEILHFAAHAVVDEVDPERSAILLTSGDGREDGLLTAREIAGLHLAGKVVVLSSCRSAGGQLLRGEGVESLARVFFQAGAHTVVANLWPLRDEAGAALFARFYESLGRGESVARALRLAQQERMRAGVPAFDWAGMVVLGNGATVPFPQGTGAPAWPWLAWLAFALAGLAIGAVVLVAVGRLRRGRSPSTPLRGRVLLLLSAARTSRN